MSDFILTVDGTKHKVHWDRPNPPTDADFKMIGENIRAHSSGKSHDPSRFEKIGQGVERIASGKPDPGSVPDTPANIKSLNAKGVSWKRYTTPDNKKWVKPQTAQEVQGHLQVVSGALGSVPSPGIIDAEKIGGTRTAGLIRGATKGVLGGVDFYDTTRGLASQAANVVTGQVGVGKAAGSLLDTFNVFNRDPEKAGAAMVNVGALLLGGRELVEGRTLKFNNAVEEFMAKHPAIDRPTAVKLVTALNKRMGKSPTASINLNKLKEHVNAAIQEKQKQGAAAQNVRPGEGGQTEAGGGGGQGPGNQEGVQATPKQGQEAQGVDPGTMTHAAGAAVRERMGLDAYNKMPREWRQAAEEAAAAGHTDPTMATHNAAHAQAGGALNDSQMVGLGVRIRELERQVSGLDVDSPQYQNLRAELDHLQEGLDRAGSTGGQALNIRKMFMPDYYSDEGALSKRFQEVQGPLSEEDRATAADLTSNQAATAERIQEHETFQQNTEGITGTPKQTRSSGMRAQGVKRVTQAKAQWKELWDAGGLAGGQVGAGFGGLSPYTGKAAAIITDMCRGYVEQGVGNLGMVIDNVYAHLKEFGVTKEDIRNAYAGRFKEDAEPKRPMSEQTKADLAFRNQAKAEAIADDVVNGRMTPEEAEAEWLGKKRGEPSARAKEAAAKAREAAKGITNKPKYSMTPEAKLARSMSQATTRGKTLSETYQELKDGKITPDEVRARLARRKGETTPELEKLREANARWRKAIDQEILNRQKKSITEKLLKLEQMGVISRPSVFAKLFGASVFGKAGAFLENVPGMSKLAGKMTGLDSPEAYGTWGTELRGMKEYGPKNLATAWDAIKTGNDRIDALYKEATGKLNQNQDFLNYVGNLHKAVKVGRHLDAFESSLARQTRMAVKKGWDLSDPNRMAAMHLQAYNDANIAILQNKNVISDAYLQGLQGLGRLVEKNVPGTSGKAVSAGARILSGGAIVRVPANFLTGTLEYTGLGIPEAVIRSQLAKRAGTQLSLVQSDAIVRAFKRGEVGAGMAMYTLAAHLLHKNHPEYDHILPVRFHGFYDPSKTDNSDSGGVDVFGVKVPLGRTLVHAQWVEAAQGYETLWDHVFGDGWAGSAPALKQGIQEITPGNVLGSHPMQRREDENVIGREAAAFICDIIDPGFVQQLAQWTDKEPHRYPRGFIEELESRSLGLRGLVPSHKMPAPPSKPQPPKKPS